MSKHLKIPKNKKAYDTFRKNINKKTKEHKVITEFRDLINHDPIVRMYISQMIKQIPPNPIYSPHRIKNIEQLLKLLNNILTIAPTYNNTLLVGTPFSAIIVYTMGTPAGFAAYRNEKINKMFKKLLKVWCKFLNSKESRYVLNDSPSGWFSKAALNKIKIKNYKYSPNKPYLGFKSWNDFFTRRLAPGVRPIAHPRNNKVIVSACDSTIYKIKKNVKKYNNFWLKTQPYSLMDMLDNQEFYVNRFIGGTVFQAFLNPFNYHRWHSPVSGTIVKAYVKGGLYFSQLDVEGEDLNDQDASEGYIAHVQTRAIIMIRADHPKLGFICVMPIGMVEISSCIINKNIRPGYHVKKGEELGYFQFGGSTHCVIFQKGVIKKFTRRTGSVKMGEQIAIAN